MKTCTFRGCHSKYYARGLCCKHYYRQPEQIAYRKVYSQSPEFKARQRAYEKTPKAKEIRKIYAQRPEVRIRNKNKWEMRKIIKEYLFILGLKEPSVLQIRRLEAMAEYLGRDIEEWRNEKMRQEHKELMER